MFLHSSIMLVYMVIIWFAIVRQFHEASWVTKLVLHAIASVLFTFSWYYTYIGLFDLLFGLQYLGEDFMQNREWILFSTFTEYILVFAVIHVIESLKHLRTKEKQAAELKELSRKQEIATLKAQINPHFLFNTLNSINASIMQQPEQAQEMVSRLSEMLRYSLDSFDREYVPLSNEIDFIKTYLSLEKKRLGDRLEVEFDIDDGLKHLSIPPMICQPLVENAVKHGIAPMEDGGKITIQIREADEWIHFSILDTGKGIQKAFDRKKRKGIGLHNTDEMLKKRYGPDAGLHIESNTDHQGGTRVYFSIPMP